MVDLTWALVAEQQRNSTKDLEDIKAVRHCAIPNR
jgi:hypothetical protein